MMVADSSKYQNMDDSKFPRAPQTPFLARAAKVVLWLFAWIVVAFYLDQWVMMPTPNGRLLWSSMQAKIVPNKQFGRPGVNFILLTFPFIILAVVAGVYVELRKAYPSARKAPESGRWSWWRRLYESLFTQPLLVRGPFGMLTAVEMIGYAMVLWITLWHMWEYTIEQFDMIDAAVRDDHHVMTYTKHMSKSMQKFNYASMFLGWASCVPLALLFLPVTRGSPILKMIDIPFEHAVKYHNWLGHLTMIFALAHSVAYGIFYALRGDFLTFFAWQKYGIANAPGVIALVAGLLMWVTSIAVCRRRFFNTFFGIHQLYIIFFIFTAWHVGVRLTLCFFGAIFLFFIDRFLRLLQSRRPVTGVTAKVIPGSNVLELKVPVANPDYTPLSFVYLNVRGLQWHPFSTSSSPLENPKCMSVMIKPNGDWTRELVAAASKGAGACPFSLWAEGPYGHESDYFLRYKHVILVAGGIGVTPFMAIIEDIMHRHRREQPGLPTTIDLNWCVRRRSEISTLQELRLLPDYKLRINVKIFITRDTEPELESKPLPVSFKLQEDTGEAKPFRGCYSDLLVAAVTCASTAGYLLLLAFFRVCVYWRYTDAKNMATKQLPGWIDVLLFFVAIAVGIVVFGGGVILFSRFFTKERDSSSNCNDVNGGARPKFADVEEHGTNLVEQSAVTSGARPNFSEVFDGARKEYGGADVGVLVSGPEGLQESVACEVRSQNFKQWQTRFHFHSVSFNL